MNNKRRSPSKEYPKKSRTVCFVGAEGHKMLDFFDSEGSAFEYGKSGLAIELLKIYKEAIKAYGRQDALFRLRMYIEKDKEQN